MGLHRGDVLRIDDGIKLDFDDVLLVPKRSTIESRKDVNLLRAFNFRHTDQSWAGVPIIASNMRSVTTPAVAKIMAKHNMLSCIPKGMELDFVDSDNVFSSIGLQDPLKAVSYQFNMIALDVPNGYTERVVEQTKRMREAFPYMVIIVGNVVTAEQTEALILAGASIVKVGIGSGAACSTRIKTGVGMPQLSAVIECSDAAHGLGGHVISDGGCSVPGDIVKAFAGGADFVMLGGMLAGHDENGQDFYGSSSERGNNEIAGGLRDYRAAEGWEIRLPARGPLDHTLQDIEGGLRSACSYIGAKTIKEIPKRATFIQVSRQANDSMWGHRVE